MRKLIIVMATLPLLLGAAVHELPVVDGVPEPSAIKAELLARKFHSVERLLSRLQDAYEVGEGDELRVSLAFEAFSNSDPALEPLLREFKAKFPKSFVPPLALAYYEENLAWLSRGPRLARRTSSEQFDAMEDHAVAAAAFYLEALRKRPKLMAAHAGRIRLTMRHGAIVQTQELADGALAIAPDSYVIRYALLNAADPKWGGSLPLIHAMVEDATKHASRNPRLRSLRGFADYVRADQERTSGNPHIESLRELVDYVRDDGEQTGNSADRCRKAMPTLDKAIGQSGHYAYFLARADARICAGEFAAAISDLTQVLAQRPNHTYALARRGVGYAALGRNEEALRDLDRTLALDPLRPKPLKSRGLLFYRAGRYAEAHRDFSQALVYGDFDAAIHRQLAYIEFFKNKNYPAAQRRIQRAIALDEGQPEDWFVLTFSQWQKGGCDFVGSGERYLALCQGAGKCDQKKHKWVESNVSQARKTGYCR